jgi:uncharacterized protein (TIGR00661 family)
MGSIVYSMAGEGRGHATRVKAVVDAIRDEHEVTLLCPGDAYDLLSEAYADDCVRIVRLPALRFGYGKGAAINPARTASMGARYFAGLPRLIERVAGFLRRTRPDLAITDFEMSLPRAAKKAGVPLVSLDHQHVRVVADLSGLPSPLRTVARVGSLPVNLWCTGQSATIVSSFYSPPLRPGHHDAQMVGVLLRPEIAAMRGEPGAHLAAYFRRTVDPHVVEALNGIGVPVRVYGLGALPARGNVEFRPVSERGFIEDLASSRGLVTSAGNQVVGEALHLGKPVLGIPEPMNFEQHVNGHYIRESGAGESVPQARVTPATIRAFLERTDEYAAAIEPGVHDGTPAAVATVRRLLA